MKKLLLGLIIIPIIPILTMVSCSSTVITDLKISITNKIVTQKTIDDALDEYTPDLEITSKVDILNKLFSGVTAENFVNFTVVEETTSKTFVLTALPNFAFGTKRTIESRLVSVDLKIQATPVSQPEINIAITAK